MNPTWGEERNSDNRLTLQFEFSDDSEYEIDPANREEGRNHKNEIETRKKYFDKPLLQKSDKMRKEAININSCDQNPYVTINDELLEHAKAAENPETYRPIDDHGLGISGKHNNKYDRYIDSNINHCIGISTLPCEGNKLNTKVTCQDKGSPNNIRRVSDIFPPHIASLWTFECFNEIQSAVLDVAAGSDDNIVLTGPTGCGKTVIFEMAVARLIQKISLLSNTHRTKFRLGNQRVIYIAPLKALCQQISLSWNKKFSHLGLRVTELTGDTNYLIGNESFKEIASSDVILTTPEKWDSISRLSEEHSYLIGSVSLLLVDEIHMLNEDTRGATLEMIITRMKALRQLPHIQKGNLPVTNLRMIALSATLPNIEDIASLFEAKHSFAFPDELRPVPLSVYVESFTPSYGGKGSNFMFDRKLTTQVPMIIEKYSRGLPTLVFCGSRKGAENVAKAVSENKDWSINLDNSSKMLLAQASESTKNSQLIKLLKRGVGLHHGALSPSDREIIEKTFLRGALAVIAATTTLALGVNLPARLVIIKGTKVYRGKIAGYEEISKSMLIQMIGRAGRVGYDSEGVAVIMTSKDQRERFEGKIFNMEVIESQLIPRLYEALNCEIHQGKIIKDIPSAMVWLKETFFYIRVKKNPSYYGFPQNLPTVQLNLMLEKSILEALRYLSIIGAIKFCEENQSITPTSEGSIFCKYMISFSTMEKISRLPYDCNIRDMLAFVSTCSEIDFGLRMSDKKILNDLNKNVRWPPPTKSFRVKKSEHKAQTLLQAAAEGLQIDDWMMRHEQNQMIDSAIRILMATCACLVCREAPDSAISAQLLARSLRVHLWEDATKGCIKQLPQIGDSIVKKLASRDINTWEDLAESSPAFIDTLVNRRHPFGSSLRSAAREILCQALTLTINRKESAENSFQVKIDHKYPQYITGGVSQPESQYIQRKLMKLEQTLYVYGRFKEPLLSNRTNSAKSLTFLILYRKLSSPHCYDFNIEKEKIANIYEINACIICNSIIGIDQCNVKYPLEEKYHDKNILEKAIYSESKKNDHNTTANLIACKSKIDKTEDSINDKILKSPEEKNNMTKSANITDANDFSYESRTYKKELHKQFEKGIVTNKFNSVLKKQKRKIEASSPFSIKKMKQTKTDFETMGIFETNSSMLQKDNEVSLMHKKSTSQSELISERRKKLELSSSTRTTPNSDMLQMLRHKGKEISLDTKVCISRLNGLKKDERTSNPTVGICKRIQDESIATKPLRKLNFDEYAYNNSVDNTCDLPNDLPEKLTGKQLSVDSVTDQRKAFRIVNFNDCLHNDMSEQKEFIEDDDQFFKNKSEQVSCSQMYGYDNMLLSSVHDKCNQSKAQIIPNSLDYPRCCCQQAIVPQCCNINALYPRPEFQVHSHRTYHCFDCLHGDVQSQHHPHLLNRDSNLPINNQYKTSENIRLYQMQCDMFKQMQQELSSTNNMSDEKISVTQLDRDSICGRNNVIHSSNRLISACEDSSFNGKKTLSSCRFDSKQREIGTLTKSEMKMKDLDQCQQFDTNFHTWKHPEPLLNSFESKSTPIPQAIIRTKSNDVKDLAQSKNVPSGANTANAIRKHLADQLVRNARVQESNGKIIVKNGTLANSMKTSSQIVTPHRPSNKNGIIRKIVNAADDTIFSPFEENTLKFNCTPIKIQPKNENTPSKGFKVHIQRKLSPI